MVMLGPWQCLQPLTDLLLAYLAATGVQPLRTALELVTLAAEAEEVRAGV